ncbi:MAG: ATP phosphoribosyltransferase [Streptomycetaceae bacterium]|jgi:ATP phosphoribosyltransferase|nr:MAG: ATP phosphoribosyltransferase [Streptomycetaceae bacterium]
MTLKVALPNKGSLSEAAIAILREAGYRQRNDVRDLIFIDPENDLEFYYLRPRDIAIYVGSGELQIGITGRDLLIDSAAEANEILGLDFGKSTFRFAAATQYSNETEIAGKRIATAYPGIVASYLNEKRVIATIVKLDGAVESSIRLGVADVIADVVSTGGTLKQAGLKVFGSPILQSEAILIERKGAMRDTQVDTLIRRLTGVVIARQYVLVDYDVESANLAAACAITPGIESPTISPLQKSGWSAVRAMVLRKDIHSVMDDLYQAGARGILVTDIHASRL